MKIYTVHAYRWGDREKHSYIHGVKLKKQSAIKLGKSHEEYRGGKYECEVIEWDLKTGSQKTIVPLPKINKLARMNAEF